MDGVGVGPSASGTRCSQYPEANRGAEQGEDLDDWQNHFIKQFYNLFHMLGRIRN